MSWYGTGSLATRVVPLSTSDTVVTHRLDVSARKMSGVYRSHKDVWQPPDLTE